MGLHMPTPFRRSQSAPFTFRQRVPDDVQKLGTGQSFVLTLPAMEGAKEHSAIVRIGREVKFSLRTRDPQLAKLRMGVALERLARQYDALRSGPKSLTHKQIIALSGKIYHFFVERYEENPGNAKNWTAVKAFNRAALEGRLLNIPALGESVDQHHELALDLFGANLTQAINALPESDEPQALEQRFGRLTDWVLSEMALSITTEDRKKLLAEIGKATTDAAKSLRKMARGDYSADPVAERFPKFEQAPSLSLQELMDRWVNERRPAPSSVSAAKTAIRSLADYLGHSDVHRISATDVIAWKDLLVTQRKSARTINDSYLALPKSLFNFGITNRLVNRNPFDGVRVANRAEAGTSRQPYSNDEVADLLRIARNNGTDEQRWMIWLAAATGARIGEIAQFWGQCIEQVDGIWVVQISAAQRVGAVLPLRLKRRTACAPTTRSRRR